MSNSRNAPGEEDVEADLDEEDIDEDLDEEDVDEDLYEEDIDDNDHDSDDEDEDHSDITMQTWYPEHKHCPTCNGKMHRDPNNPENRRFTCRRQDDIDFYATPEYGYLGGIGCSEIGYFFIINGEKVQVAGFESSNPAHKTGGGGVSAASSCAPVTKTGGVSASSCAPVTKTGYGGVSASSCAPVTKTGGGGVSSSSCASRGVVCRFWISGTCRNGANCKFNHFV